MKTKLSIEELFKQHGPSILGKVLAKDYKGLVPEVQAMAVRYMTVNDIVPITALDDQEIIERVRSMPAAISAVLTVVMHALPTKTF